MRINMRLHMRHDGTSKHPIPPYAKGDDDFAHADWNRQPPTAANDVRGDGTETQPNERPHDLSFERPKPKLAIVANQADDTVMHWSAQQDAAIKSVKTWLKDPSAPQVFRLFGYAGTGKTTLAVELANTVKGLVLYAAYTGKAALVMRRKGCTNASTIHSLIYEIDGKNQGWQPKFLLNEDSQVKYAKLVVIDECSMIDAELANDLMSFGAKILVLGDPAQLPPVKGAGFFTACQPDVMLTEVHRQALNNPIIAMSMLIRQGGDLAIGQYGDSQVIHRRDIDQAQVLKADQVLVGLNKTRLAYNERIRQLLGRSSFMPVPGDKLVCLKNDRGHKLLNGGLWTATLVRRMKGDIVPMQIVSDDVTDEPRPTYVKVRRKFFEGTDDMLHFDDKKNTQEFTYGYALTCHKAQGSQWNDIVVFDEAAAFRDDAARWRYTAVTRAAERITIVKSQS